jgi:hypothetical protein
MRYFRDPGFADPFTLGRSIAMRLPRFLTSVTILILVTGCAGSGPGAGGIDPPPQPTPLGPPKRPCGARKPEPPPEIEIAVAADGSVSSGDQYRFFEDSNQRIIWTLQDQSKRLEILFENDAAFKVNKRKDDWQKEAKRTGNPALSCGAYKYTIQVFNGTTKVAEVDPVIIIRE